MKPSAAPAFFCVGRAALLAGVALLMAACDTTPRERQDIVKDSARKLDTLADKAGVALKRASNRAARFDSVSKTRSRQPLDNSAASQFTEELLGSYANIGQLTVPELVPAYTQLLRQTRDKRRTWTQRDWDYATAVFRQLNDQYRALRLDLPANQEFRIKALQTEFTALEAGRDIKDLREAVRDKPADAR
ncbi:hypothetical protein D3Y59_12575 [Hymenobacter oligotrophus]|uniref:Lipoprotein n=1 Tax=Hymenobacter oligotrophus TaxID=2319843 RepID=A0A3B7RU39_9BACT|nr:hypothetical protein [Hymenobacter oligotrophus]AYA37807.1 hypothetical protein D3Y59_12575 [Hymenobacter oligotrophus]